MATPHISLLLSDIVSYTIIIISDSLGLAIRRNAICRNAIYRNAIRRNAIYRNAMYRNDNSMVFKGATYLLGQHVRVHQ